MTLRWRLLLAFGVLVFVPVVVLSLGLRRGMNERMSAEYEARLETVRQVIEQDLRLEAAAIDDRLAAIRLALSRDAGFRSGAVAGDERWRGYVLDYAEHTMRTAGLSMLQIHDEDGRIVSSGHFRNEHGRADGMFVAALERQHDRLVLTRVRAAEDDFLALVRRLPVRLGERTFVLVGGAAVDAAFLRRLARDEVAVSLRFPGGSLTSRATEVDAAVPVRDVVSREIVIPVILPASLSVETGDAVLRVSQSRAPLAALLREMEAWVLWVTLATGAAALLLAVWISSRISRPIAALADKAAVLDLDRLDVQFEAGSGEVGTLSRVLDELTERLRTSTRRVRDTERRATVGDLARQVNHDIKNGLIPIRNVMRHVTQVAAEDPAALAAVLAERRQTLDSSISYLETLATNYERLSMRPARRLCDLNALIQDVVCGVHGHANVDLRTSLAADLPPVHGDAVALRRVLENLTANAIESLEGRPGSVTVSTEHVSGTDGPAVVRMKVADTGGGMTPEEAAKIFNDFYTTKKDGTGLGLSIVRRLVMDMNGTLRVDSEPGSGTRMTVELPLAGSAS